MVASHWPWIGFLPSEFRSPSELPSYQGLLPSYCSSYPEPLPTLYTNLTGGRCLTYIGTEGFASRGRPRRASSITIRPNSQLPEPDFHRQDTQHYGLRAEFTEHYSVASKRIFFQGDNRGNNIPR